METLSLAAIAAMTARDVLRAHPGLGPAGAEELAHRIRGSAGHFCVPSSHSATPPWFEQAPVWCCA